ncbi:MAG: hypothetical protein LBU95_01785 [Rikenellaceae bacterium]|jgi:hypothetical protein|nr:hypothetical protein [Rikenellaceae bacterium]
MKKVSLFFLFAWLALSAAAQSAGFDAEGFKKLNEQVMEADGETAEVLGKRCVAMVLSDPAYVAGYLDARRPLMEKYAMFMGAEFYFKAEGTTDMALDYQGFKTRITRRTGDAVASRDALKRLYSMIAKAIDSMEEAEKQPQPEL